MLKKWLENYKKIVQRAWILLSKPEMGWRIVVDEQASSKQVTREYVIPFLIMCVLAEFLGYLFNSYAGIQFAFIKALFSAMALYGSWWVSVKACKYLVQRFHKIEISDAVSNTLVSYSFTVIFLLNIVLAFFPSLFFLALLALYTLYVVFVGVGVVLDIDENSRGKLSISLSALIILMPLLIEWILGKLLPNAPL